MYDKDGSPYATRQQRKGIELEKPSQKRENIWGAAAPLPSTMNHHKSRGWATGNYNERLRHLAPPSIGIGEMLVAGIEDFNSSSVHGLVNPCFHDGWRWLARLKNARVMVTI